MVRIMRTSKVAASILMLIVLILSIQAYQMVNAQTAVPLETKALTYVKNVLPFNMSHYNITVGNAYSLPSGPNDPTVTQAVDIDMKSGDSTMHVVCLYVNRALHQCGVTPTGTPFADRTYASVKDIAVRILLAYQEQTGLDSTPLLNTLSLVNDTEITSVKLGNVSLSITHFPDIIGSQTVNGMPVPVASNSSFSVTYDWDFIQNGVPCNQVALTFDKGVFCNLQDERAINTTSNTISVDSHQQAATPPPAPTTATQENFTSSTTMSPQSTNGESAQSNQLSSKSTLKTDLSQNVIAVPILITAVSAYVIVVLLMITYKNKNQVNKIKREVSKRD
jgi:hypothetical protein